MGLFKRSMAVTSINFNCWRQDFRVKFILLFTALIVFNTLKPVLQYGLDNGAVSTPLLLPLLFGSTDLFCYSVMHRFIIRLHHMQS